MPNRRVGSATGPLVRGLREAYLWRTTLL